MLKFIAFFKKQEQLLLKKCSAHLTTEKDEPAKLPKDSASSPSATQSSFKCSYLLILVP